MNINVFIPYSREYIEEKYRISGSDIFHLIEDDIIPRFLDKISRLNRLEKIYLFSNNMSHQNYSTRSKLEFVNRPPESHSIDDREELIKLMFRSQTDEPFVLANPLFPLISIETFEKFIDKMMFCKKNIFLGVKGNTRQNVNESFNKIESHHFWDYGALTGYFDSSNLQEWEVFQDFSSLETMSVRNINDIAMIKTIQSMGI